MLSSVLNSEQAIIINIEIIKAFVRLRELAIAHKDLAIQLNQLEQTFIDYAKDTNIELNEHAKKINDIFECLQYLIDVHKPSQIGFKTD